MPATTRTPKPLKYKSLNGLSEKQLSEHHDVLYAGYVKKLNEIEQKLETVDRSSANATYSDLRALKKEEIFATGGIYLHEGYFDNLGAAGGPPTGAIADLIQEDFGSLEKWTEDFKACGMAARGWVVLAFNWNDGRLHNYLTDIHSEGVWNASTLLVMDMYEHAYFIDYATQKKAYIETFFKNIDWKDVNAKVDGVGIPQYRAKMKAAGK
jgi:Fe-Mn family superoxide dismutase